MRLPNKLYAYQDSILAMLPAVLNEISKQPRPVGELYGKVKSKVKGVADFIAVMDCLYALQKVDIDDEGRVFLCLQK